MLHDDATEMHAKLEQMEKFNDALERSTTEEANWV